MQYNCYYCQHVVLLVLHSPFLFKVAQSEPEESKSPDEEVGGMAGALARALEMRSNAIHGDSGKELCIYMYFISTCMCMT